MRSTRVERTHGYMQYKWSRKYADFRNPKASGAQYCGRGGMKDRIERKEGKPPPWGRSTHVPLSTRQGYLPPCWPCGAGYWTQHLGIGGRHSMSYSITAVVCSVSRQSIPKSTKRETDVNNIEWSKTWKWQKLDIGKSWKMTEMASMREPRQHVSFCVAIPHGHHKITVWGNKVTYSIAYNRLPQAFPSAGLNHTENRRELTVQPEILILEAVWADSRTFSLAHAHLSRLEEHMLQRLYANTLLSPTK